MSVRDLAGVISVVEGSDTLVSEELENVFKTVLEDPVTLNKVVKLIFGQESGWRLLEDLSIQFKTFDAQGEDRPSGIGLAYSYSKDIQRTLISESVARQSGMSFTFDAHGNVAFDASSNPNDFLVTDLSLHLFHSRGGAVEVSDTVADRLNELELVLVDFETAEELDASTAWREFLALVSQNMSTQFYVDLSAVAGLESNQDFTQKQYKVGMDLGLDVRAWNRESVLAQYNFFDWPFAAIRWLSGMDDRFAPRGSHMPSLLVGLHYLDPRGYDLRAAVGDSTKYFRFSLETSFKTPVLSVGGNPAFFEANYRYYQELDASAAVKQADLDHSSYFIAFVGLSDGPYVSYSNGRLPFDAVDDQVYELGFQWSF